LIPVNLRGGSSVALFLEKADTFAQDSPHHSAKESKKAYLSFEGKKACPRSRLALKSYFLVNERYLAPGLKG
jgi:hypothetical protein